jgi:hypothetical protein
MTNRVRVGVGYTQLNQFCFAPNSAFEPISGTCVTLGSTCGSGSVWVSLDGGLTAVCQGLATPTASAAKCPPGQVLDTARGVCTNQVAPPVSKGAMLPTEPGASAGSSAMPSCPPGYQYSVVQAGCIPHPGNCPSGMVYSPAANGGRGGCVAAGGVVAMVPRMGVGRRVRVGLGAPADASAGPFVIAACNAPNVFQQDGTCSGSSTLAMKTAAPCPGGGPRYAVGDKVSGAITGGNCAPQGYVCPPGSGQLPDGTCAVWTLPGQPMVMPCPAGSTQGALGWCYPTSGPSAAYPVRVDPVSLVSIAPNGPSPGSVQILTPGQYGMVPTPGSANPDTEAAATTTVGLPTILAPGVSPAPTIGPAPSPGPVAQFTPTCPSGSTVQNGLCVDGSGNIVGPPACPSGTTFDATTGACLQNPASTTPPPVTTPPVTTGSTLASAFIAQCQAQGGTWTPGVGCVFPNLSNQAPVEQPASVGAPARTPWTLLELLSAGAIGIAAAIYVMKESR